MYRRVWSIKNEVKRCVRVAEDSPLQVHHGLAPPSPSVTPGRSGGETETCRRNTGHIPHLPSTWHFIQQATPRSFPRTY